MTWGADEGIDQFVQLIRASLKMDGNRIHFNVVNAANLRAAQESSEQHTDLIARGWLQRRFL